MSHSAAAGKMETYAPRRVDLVEFTGCPLSLLPASEFNDAVTEDSGVFKFQHPAGFLHFLFKLCDLGGALGVTQLALFAAPEGIFLRRFGDFQNLPDTKASRQP